MGLHRYREMRDFSRTPEPRGGKRAARAPLPQFVAPQLATLVSAPPAAGEWVYEVKHDGYRFLARISDGEVRLYTRAGNDWTAKLPHLAREIQALGLEDSLLDGADALVICTEWNEFRRPDFERVKAALAAPVVFDGRNLYDPKRMAELGFTYARVDQLLPGPRHEGLDAVCCLGPARRALPGGCMPLLAGLC